MSRCPVGAVPYRIDLRRAGEDALDRLVELGALDVDAAGDAMAALMPDSVSPEQAARALGVEVTVSAAVGRDADSVWVLTPRPVAVGCHVIHLTESAAFGTGRHATTALCLEALRDAVPVLQPGSVLDVGTGSGVLAIAALMLGVPRATGLDIDAGALRVAAANARLNGVDRRLKLLHGGPEGVTETFPLVLANVLPAALVEMAPSLGRCVGHHGQAVLSGIPESVLPDVERAYVRLGMRAVRQASRGGWAALLLQASW